MNKLINQILDFRNERDWNKYHEIKNLLIGLNIEVAELQEIFLWKSEGDVFEHQSIENELSDIFIFLVYIADHFDIDLEQSIINKIKIHKQHYPINLSKGNTTKYTHLKSNKNNDEDNI